MKTNLKTGNTPKDNQIKPITQTKELEHETTVEPLQTSQLYQETNTLIDIKNQQAQPSNSSSEVTKNNNEACQENKETVRVKQQLKKK